MFENPTHTNPITTNRIPKICNFVNFRLNINKEIKAVNITMKPFNI